MKPILSSVRMAHLLVGALFVGGMASGPAVADETSRGDPSMTLWYARPAAQWATEALPIGNGRIGAMIFGKVGHERIALNEDTVWSCLLYTSPSPRDLSTSRMPSSA